MKLDVNARKPKNLTMPEHFCKVCTRFVNFQKRWFPSPGIISWTGQGVLFCSEALMSPVQSEKALITPKDHESLLCVIFCTKAHFPANKSEVEGKARLKIFVLLCLFVGITNRSAQILLFVVSVVTFSPKVC